MRWIKPARLPILVAWGVILGLLIWVLLNPQFLAPQLSSLVGKHLLGIEEGNLRVSDFRVRVFEGLDLYGLSLTLPSETGGTTLVTADTVQVDFTLGQVLGVVPHVSRAEIRSPEIYSRAGADSLRRKKPLAFPRLAIDQLFIHDASLEFSHADGKLAERISRLDFRGGLRSDKDIDLKLRGCRVDWDTHHSRLDQLRGRLVVDRNLVRADSLYGLFNGHKVKISGQRSWDEDLALKVQAHDVSVAEVEDLIDMTIGFKATGDLAADFKTEGGALLYDGLFSGELEGFDLQDVRGKAVIGETEVALTQATGRVNGAGFTGSGRFDVSDPNNVAFVLEGDVSDVDMAKGLVPGEEDLPVTDGQGHLKIEHKDVPLWTRVTGELTAGRIEILPFDTCRVDVEATADSLRFNQVAVSYRNLNALLVGISGLDKVFSGRVDFFSSDIRTLPAGWNWPAMSGQAQGGGRLTGALDDLRFAGHLKLSEFKLDEVQAQRSTADLVIDDALEEAKIHGRLQGQGLSIGGVPLGGFSLVGATSPTSVAVDSFRSVLGDTTVSLAFAADIDSTRQAFHVQHVAVDLEGTRWSLERPVDFSRGPGFFNLPGLEFSSNQGRVECAGHFFREADVAGHLNLEGFDLGLLNPFLQTRTPLVGRATADLEVHGQAGDPVVQLDGRLTGADFPMARVDTLDVTGQFSQGVMKFDNLALESEFGRLDLRGTIEHSGAGIEDFWPGAELDLDVSIPDGDWAFLDQFQMPALDRLAGRFSGDLVIGGSSDDPEIVGTLHSAPFNVHWLHLDELDGQIWADSEELVLGDLRGHKDDLALSGRIEVPLDMDFLSEPVSPLDGPFYMQLEIPPDSNLEPMSRATNGFIRSSGRGSATVVASGPLEHPLYQGRVQIRDAGFVLPQQEEIYSHTSCQGVFEGDTLKISSIEGREGLKGRFTGQGGVVFKGLELESFDVQLDLDRFLVASIPDLRAIVSGRGCHLSSEFVGPDSLLVPKFSGRLEVQKARYTGDFKEQPNAVDPMQPTVAPDWLGDLHLHGAPRTVRILNREMELYLGGDMDLIRGQDGMFMRGALDVNSGRLVVFNNSFNVKRGRLDFSREVGFDPQMDIDAETRYRLRSRYSSNSIIEHIGVHVGGTINKPVISFSSERGYSREAIQRMLLGLEPEATPEGDAGRLANTSISAGFNVLEREIARELDIFDTFEIDQIQRERETGGSGLDPLIGVGKYIGSDLYLKYAQGIRQDDRDFLVEYQINDHLLLQSEVRRRIDENQGQPTYNLDLKYRFEY